MKGLRSLVLPLRLDGLITIREVRLPAVWIVYTPPSLLALGFVWAVEVSLMSLSLLDTMLLEMSSPRSDTIMPPPTRWHEA